MKHEIEGERAYPIYTVNVRWTQDGEHDEKYPNWYKGLRAGRMWNSIGSTSMYLIDPGPADVLVEAKKWWKKYKAEKLNSKNPGRPKFTITGPKYETWCLTRFQHWTFDDGLSDQEYLASFERYVRRYEYMQDFFPGDMPKNYVSLMGAEDRWRWHGAGETGAQDERTDPPCRCVHCKKGGVVRIGH